MRFEALFAAAIAAGVTAMPAIARDISPALASAALQAEKGVPQAEAPKAAVADKAGKTAMLGISDPLARERFGGAVPRRGRKARENIDMTTTSSVDGKARLSSFISRYAETYGVPVALADAVIRVESNFRVHARGRAGEIGLMQIKPATARLMGYTGSAKGLYNPETNIKYGMKYLARAYRLGGGSTCRTALKYNAGHAATRMTGATSAYCGKIKRHIVD